MPIATPPSKPVERVMFIGSKNLGLAALRCLHALRPEALCAVVTFDDRSDVNSRSKLNEIVAYAEQHALPVHVLRKPSSLAEVVERERPELCFVLGWYWLLPASLLARVPAGFIGMHGSLLPSYRGNAPLVWAVLNGETETGLTLFYFDAGMDSGDVVAQRRIPIEEDDDIGTLLDKLGVALEQTLTEVYPRLLGGTAGRQVQIHERATYCAARTPEDGRIDWTRDNRRVHDFIRAQAYPYPGAFTKMPDGRRLYVWEARVYAPAFYGTPGQVVRLLEGDALVTCGSGAVRLRTVQVEGGERVAAAELLKYNSRLGDA